MVSMRLRLLINSKSIQSIFSRALGFDLTESRHEWPLNFIRG